MRGSPLGRKEGASWGAAVTGSFPWAGQGPLHWHYPPPQLHLHQRKTQLLKLELLKYLEYQVLR